jgi:hypothetical protein
VIRWVRVEDTTWPVDVATDDEDAAQWVQRYGTPERVVEQRMSVASVLSAYAHLTDSTLTMRQAEAALHRARTAAREAG